MSCALYPLFHLANYYYFLQFFCNFLFFNRLFLLNKLLNYNILPTPHYIKLKVSSEIIKIKGFNGTHNKAGHIRSC